VRSGPVAGRETDTGSLVTCCWPRVHPTKSAQDSQVTGRSQPGLPAPLHSLAGEARDQVRASLHPICRALLPSTVTLIGSERTQTWGTLLTPSRPSSSFPPRPRSRPQELPLLGPVCFAASISRVQAELFGAGHSPLPGLSSRPQLQTDVCSV